LGGAGGAGGLQVADAAGALCAQPRDFLMLGGQA